MEGHESPKTGCKGPYKHFGEVTAHSKITLIKFRREAKWFSFTGSVSPGLLCENVANADHCLGNQVVLIDYMKSFSALTTVIRDSLLIIKKRVKSKNIRIKAFLFRKSLFFADNQWLKDNSGATVCVYSDIWM